MKCSRRPPASAEIEPISQPQLRYAHNQLVAGSSPTSSTTQSHGRAGFPFAAEQPRNGAILGLLSVSIYGSRRRMPVVSPSCL
jgi:hypothetical protein